MDFKGTQGEWRLMVGGFSKKGDIPNLIQVYAANDDLEMICKVYKDGLLHKKNQNFEANAKLIAAAPKLLSALQDAIIGLEWRKDEPPTAFDKADDEKLHEWKELINQIL